MTGGKYYKRDKRRHDLEQSFRAEREAENALAIIQLFNSRLRNYASHGSCEQFAGLSQPNTIGWSSSADLVTR